MREDVFTLLALTKTMMTLTKGLESDPANLESSQNIIGKQMTV